MSANRDRSQKVTFVYSNLYQLYKKGSEAVEGSSPENAVPVVSPTEGVNPGLLVDQAQARVHQSGTVIKTGDRNSAVGREVAHYQPMTLIAKKPEAFGIQLAKTAKAERAGIVEQNHALDNLKQNMQTLNDLHARLRFMLKELEELVKE